MRDFDCAVLHKQPGVLEEVDNRSERSVKLAGLGIC